MRKFAVVTLQRLGKPSTTDHLWSCIKGTEVYRVASFSSYANRTYRTLVGDLAAVEMHDQISSRTVTSSEVPYNQEDSVSLRKHQIGENVSRRDKISFLVNTLLDLKESKDAVYGALDAWVAWEQKFPTASLRRALITLEKEQQWHRIIQVIKWMLSKGQGTTVGTYQQLIRALDMDNRAEEAHAFWVKKVSHDLHSVPWQFCHLMISVYYRNNMLERLIKLFKDLESYERKPRDKLIVQKVANAYEMLGFLEDKQKVLDKYQDLFDESSNKKHHRKNRKTSSKKAE